MRNKLQLDPRPTLKFDRENTRAVNLSDLERERNIIGHLSIRVFRSYRRFKIVMSRRGEICRTCQCLVFVLSSRNTFCLALLYDVVVGRTI